MVNGLPLSLEVLINSVHEQLSLYIVSVFLYLIPIYAYRQILCHYTALHSVNNSSFQSGRELCQFCVAVQLGSVSETSSPSED